MNSKVKLRIILCSIVTQCLLGCNKNIETINLNCTINIEIRDSICALSNSCAKKTDKVFFELKKEKYKERINSKNEEKEKYGWVLTENQKRKLHSNPKYKTEFEESETNLDVNEDKIQYVHSSNFKNIKGEYTSSNYEEIIINRITGSIEGTERTGLAFNPERINLSGQCEKVDAKKF